MFWIYCRLLDCIETKKRNTEKEWINMLLTFFNDSFQKKEICSKRLNV